jgi:Secretion system C-terminal sorting domain
MFMRKVLLSLFTLFLFSPSKAQPSSFKWPAAPAQDQIEQGPCNDFATVGLVETWYYCLFGTRDQISLAHPYSICGGANAGAGSNLLTTLTMFQDDGVVDATTLPWTNVTACNSSPSDPYWANNIVTGNKSTLVYGACGTPYKACAAGEGFPTYRYMIAGFSQLNIGQLTPNTLKLAIMNDGPIVLNMVDPQLHGDVAHAYLLYGWNAQGDWLLTDSWPTPYTTGLDSTNQNLDTLFAAVDNTNSYVLTNSASFPAVWRQDFNTSDSGWTNDPKTTNSTMGCIYPACSNAFSISGPSTVTTSGEAFSVGGTTLLTNPTITWSSQAVTDGAEVSFSPTTGTTTTATGILSGTAYIVANITRPNGLCEQLKYLVNVEGENVPFTLTQTMNACGSGDRTIQYQATSSYPLSCSWTLHPPGGGGVYTTTNGCTFTMDFTILPSSYGITMSVTSSALPGATGGATTGGPAMSCSGGEAIRWDSLTDSTNVINAFGVLPSSVTSVQVTPNPASGIVTLRLPAFRVYDVKLVTTLGSVVFAAHSAVANLDIDVSRLANGVYIVQTRDSQTGEITVRKVLVQK